MKITGKSIIRTCERRQLARMAVESGALCFGEFVLKSGRKSNFFFDSSKFNNGKLATYLGMQYAAAIQKMQLPYDMLFGPAYKGIPLTSLVAACLYRDFGHSVDYVYSRKERKTHGEKGCLAGASLNGRRVIIVDDVLTAGTAARTALRFLKAGGGEAVGLIVCFDRQEKGSGQCSAKTELENMYGIRVCSLFSISDLAPDLQSRLYSAG